MFEGLLCKLKDFILLPPEEEMEEQSGKDVRPIKEVMAGMRGRYEEMVKPHIESGNYFAASCELRDIYTYCGFRSQELFFEVHSGLKYFAAMKILMEDLETATVRPHNAIEAFEAYQAQTRLPSKRDLGKE
jgi:hypothetical protein